MTPTPGRVFISYSRADIQFALRLADDLRKAGVVVWIDQRDIRAGEHWDIAIETALNSVTTVLVLLSPAACVSKNVMDEVSFAMNKGKRVIPVLRLECEIPFRLERLQWIDVTRDYEHGLRLVIETVNSTYDISVESAARAVPFEASSGCVPISVDPWKPAIPPVFVGRNVLLKKLCGAWDEGRSVSLVGDWRIGKSSILGTCYEQIRESGRPVRLLNGKSQEGASPAEFVKAATGLAARTDPDGAADVLAHWARQGRRPGLLPLLLVDECDVLIRRFEYRFFERLRGMLDDLCLGVSTRRELDRIFKDAG